MLRIAEHIYNIGLSNKARNDTPLRINLYQIHKRLFPSLPEDEKLELYHIKISAGNLEVLFCANVLLENSFEAKHAFESMDPELREFYQSLRIFRLYEQLV